MQAHYGMSLELFQPTDYDNLCLPLRLPLSNEQVLIFFQEIIILMDFISES